MSGNADFEDFFRSVYPSARHLARQIVGSATEAEDVAAEAFARALLRWRRIGSLAWRDAWVLKVTANIAVDVLRKRRTPSAVAQIRENHDQDLALTRVAVANGLARLPRRQQEAVVLHHLAGLPLSEVAESLGVSVNTVKRHLQRGTKGLRGAMSSSTGERA